APSELRQEILDFQAAIVSDAGLLPKEEPHPGLRSQVLAAVASAHADSLTEVAGRIGPRWYQGTNLWRAAALIALTGPVVMASFLSNAMNTNATLRRQASGLEVARAVADTIGAQVIANANQYRSLANAAQPAVHGLAIIGNDSAAITAFGL